MSRPSDTKVWLTSADDNVLRFTVPEAYRRGGYAVSLLILCGMVELFFLLPHAERLLLIDFDGVAAVGILTYLFSLSEITINLKARTYQTVSRWPWYVTTHDGSLDDLRAVYVSYRDSVGLVLKKPSLLRRTIPIGSAGFGGNAARLAQEVARLTGLEVVTSL